jgi:hypothetical protein
LIYINYIISKNFMRLKSHDFPLNYVSNKLFEFLEIQGLKNGDFQNQDFMV